MTRSVVFKTKGKLDLRSITTFGLNAKPESGHPIGQFGTGLKYAIAVLAREKIPVTLYVDGRKWTITQEVSDFRGKEFQELCLIQQKMWPAPDRKIKLPFTTHLGKHWKLWQAFRELESNTRDENGHTLVVQDGNDNLLVDDLEGKGCTLIRVESEEFVQEFFDKDKTFLPDGLTQREGTEDVQVFDRPSDCIYYRGIRVLDLGENERSELTYNILRPMELTEDRTLKSKWDAQYYIAAAVVRKSDPEIAKKLITAPEKSFEGGLNYTYGVPSKEFLDIAEAIPEKLAHSSVAQVIRNYRPKPPIPKDPSDWLEPIIDAIRAGDWDLVENNIQPYREETIQILERARQEMLKEKANNDGTTGSISPGNTYDDGREVGSTQTGVSNDTSTPARSLLDYDIPF